MGLHIKNKLEVADDNKLSFIFLNASKLDIKVSKTKKLTINGKYIFFYYFQSKTC